MITKHTGLCDTRQLAESIMVQEHRHNRNCRYVCLYPSKKLIILICFFSLLFAVMMAELLCKGTCVLPNYTPALQPHYQVEDVADNIRRYFIQGYNNSEILGFLGILHGITIGIRTLKRWLRILGLKRQGRRNQAPLQEIVAAILREMEGYVGSHIGYREMTRRLRIKHNLTVTRDTVMHAMREIDPEGVENRRRHRLQRRRYSTPGPNFLWHLDGWDKLKPYGFCVHGCIDGFSRRILWLEVASTNNDPRVVADYFLSTIQQLGGVPRLIRTDKGTENSMVAVLQQLFRNNDRDGLAGNKSIIQGKSTANQRIEAFWSKLRQGGGGWWINFFKDLRDSGTYRDHCPVHRECLKFCFMPVIRQELYSLVELWNTKRIEVKKGEVDVIRGKPDVMFFLPEVYSTRCYLVGTDERVVRICKDLYTQQCYDCSPEIEALAQIIEPGYRQPVDTREALRLFITITTELDRLAV